MQKLRETLRGSLYSATPNMTPLQEVSQRRALLDRFLLVLLDRAAQLGCPIEESDRIENMIAGVLNVTNHIRKECGLEPQNIIYSTIETPVLLRHMLRHKQLSPEVVNSYFSELLVRHGYILRRILPSVSRMAIANK